MYFPIKNAVLQKWERRTHRVLPGKQDSARRGSEPGPQAGSLEPTQILIGSGRFMCHPLETV